MTSSKNLILVRHAKSSSADAGMSDHERPLNRRGKRDASRMARRLAKRGPRPQSITTSSAVRALTTARTFAAELGLDADVVSVQPEVYGATALDMIDLIRELDDQLDCVMIVGHNPTFLELASRLAAAKIGQFPTCSVVTLRLDSGHWADVRDHELQLVDFDDPKMSKS